MADLIVTQLEQIYTMLWWLVVIIGVYALVDILDTFRFWFSSEE